MCDVFLVLAQAPGGLTCFVVPRVLPDGTRNTFRLQRLKDKLGNRSNASSEVELDGTWARRLGDEGRGVRDHHRDGLGDPARLRARLDRADARRPSRRRPTTRRTGGAFGGLLADKPLMRNVLADLAVESEAATALAMRLAHAFDSGERELPPAGGRGRQVLGLQADARRGRRGAGVPGRQRLRRGERAAAALPGGAAELDLGGLGQRQRARRAAGAGPRAGRGRGVPGRGRAGARGRPRGWTRRSTGSARSSSRPTRASARRLVESMALVLQGSLLVRHAPADVADAFCASRLAGDRGQAARHPARRPRHRRASSPGPRPATLP